MIELRMPIALPSLNSFVKLHWSQYAKRRKEWGQWVMVAKAQARVLGRPELKRVRIEIERRTARPIYDQDNLQASRKWLMDALVQNGILADDSTEVIEQCTVTQVKVPKKNGETVVRIYPLPAQAGAAIVSSL